jgi:hypothetical protein
VSDDLKLVVGFIGGVLTFLVGDRLLVFAALYWTERLARRKDSQ